MSTNKQKKTRKKSGSRAPIRPSKGESREALIRSAAELFLENGIERTTFAQIAGRVGLTQPAMYIHFKDKMDLLEKVILWSASIGRGIVDAKIDQRKPALERLRCYIEANYSLFREQQVHAHSISALFYFALSTEPMRNLYSQVVGLSIERIETMLIQAQLEKQVLDIDVKKCAESIYQLIIGGCYRSAYAQSEREFSFILETAWETVQLIIGQGSREWNSGN